VTRGWIAVLLAACASFTVPAAGQTYPAHVIKLVVPFPPGQGADILMRLIAERLGARVGQPVIIDNRPGAGGTIGTAFVGSQAPDGYTLLMGASGPMAISPTLQPRVAKYSTTRDFEPITGVASVAQVFVVNPASDIKTLSDLVKAARMKPGEVTFGSSGNGTTQHLFVAEFASMAGIKLTHVPYKGAAPALTDLIGGQVTLVSDTVPSVLPFVTAGKLRALAVTSSKRSPFLPNVPTVAEQGFKGYSAEGWITILAPAGTPAAIADRLDAEIRKVLAEPEIQKKMGEMGFVEMSTSRSALRDFMAAEIAKWKKVIDDNHITVE
jgi:tripartite-type tricarboxylate transporter receptor subunit TctC